MKKTAKNYLHTYRYASKCITSRMFIVIIAGILAFSFTACEDENTIADPKIHLNDTQGFISSDTTLSPGTKMNFSISAEADNGIDLTNFLIRMHADSSIIVFDTGINTSSLNWEGEFTKGTAAEEQWEFIIRDKEGNENSTSITILADTGSSFNPLKNYADVMLGAQNNTGIGSHFSLSDGSIYTHAEATNDNGIQEKIDMIYFYVEDDKNTIASPGANMDAGIFPGNFEDWAVRNTTRFIKTELSIEDFTQAENDSLLITNYIEGEGKRKAKKLKSDDIYVFKNQEGKLGIFRVKEVNGTEDGDINIDIKIQEGEE